MKIVGARTPGIAAPGTRRISLSARRIERADHARASALMRPAACLRSARTLSTDAIAATIAMPARPLPSDGRSRHAVDDRVAHPVGDRSSAGCSPRSCRPAPAAACAGRTPTTGTGPRRPAGRCPGRVEALRARSASTTPSAAERRSPASRRSAARPATPGDAALRCARRRSGRRQEPDDLRRAPITRGRGQPAEHDRRARDRRGDEPVEEAALDVQRGARCPRRRRRAAATAHRRGAAGSRGSRGPAGSPAGRSRVQAAGVDGQEERGEDHERRQELRPRGTSACAARGARARRDARAGAPITTAPPGCGLVAPSRWWPVFSTKTSSSVGSHELERRDAASPARRARARSARSRGAAGDRRRQVAPVARGSRSPKRARTPRAPLESASSRERQVQVRVARPRLQRGRRALGDDPARRR